MLIEVTVPQLPESVSEATLMSWHKKVGQAVSRDENLIDLETDKVVLELPAPQAGVIVEIIVEDGATVVSGQLIAKIDTAAKAAMWLRPPRPRRLLLRHPPPPRLAPPPCRPPPNWPRKPAWTCPRWPAPAATAAC